MMSVWIWSLLVTGYSKAPDPHQRYDQQRKKLSLKVFQVDDPVTTLFSFHLSLSVFIKPWSLLLSTSAFEVLTNENPGLIFSLTQQGQQYGLFFVLFSFVFTSYVPDYKCY